jgi:hypothetical protein
MNPGAGLEAVEKTNPSFPLPETEPWSSKPQPSLYTDYVFTVPCLTKHRMSSWCGTELSTGANFLQFPLPPVFQALRQIPSCVKLNFMNVLLQPAVTF